MSARPLDFVGIGAMGSGTTSLFKYLERHPGLRMPAAKELPYFCDEQEPVAAGWDRFASTYFGGAPADTLLGTMTPQYMADPRVPQRLWRHNPSLKLIALLREPLARARSAYMLCRRMGTETRSFDEAVTALLQEANLRRERATAWDAQRSPRSYVAMGEYARILHDYAARFGRDQLLILFTEDLARDPSRVLESVSRFLGIDPAYRPRNLHRRYRVGGMNRRISEQRLKLIKPVARLALRALPRKVSDAFLFWFSAHWNARTGREPLELQPAIRDRLREFYEPDVRRLEREFSVAVPWPNFSPARTGLGVAAVLEPSL